MRLRQPWCHLERDALEEVVQQSGDKNVEKI
jgi:hypothetical protein